MHDLDQERREKQQARDLGLGERTFKFGGEEWVHVRDCPYDVIRRAALLEEMEGAEVFAQMEQVVLELIEPGEEMPPPPGFMVDGIPPAPKRYANHERFKRLLLRREDPITADDLSTLLRWLLGAATGRPTSPPSESTDGSKPSGISSTEPSSSPPAEVSTA